MIRTHNLGHVAVGSELSIKSGTPHEVRGYILEREARDTARRRGYGKAARAAKKSKPTFTEYKPKPHPLYN